MRHSCPDRRTFGGYPPVPRRCRRIVAHRPEALAAAVPGRTRLVFGRRVNIPSSSSDAYADGGALPPTTVYLAICLPPGTMPGGLAEIQLAITEAALKVSESGHPVRYLNGMYMPAQTRLLCVFAAESDEAAHATVDLVRLPYVQLRAITDQ